MDTLERLITELKRDRREVDPSLQRDHFTDASCSSPEDPWSRLAQLEGRLRSCDTPHDEQIELTESDYSRESLSTPSASSEIHVDWAMVNKELLQRGLPPVLDEMSKDGLPTPQAAQTALQCALQELTRLHHQAEALKTAAELAIQREAAAVKKLQMEARNFPKEEKEWQKLASKAQEDAARAKESEMASRHSSREAALEAAALKTSLDRLQRQAFAKNSENEALKQQLQGYLDKETQIHLAAKESVKRIRQVFASERVNALEGSRSALIVNHTPSTAASILTMNALQVAKVYESQLRAAEEETRAARAEIFLLREKYLNSSQSIGPYSNETAIAAKKVAKAESLAARAQEEAELLREEVSRRPAAEEFEGLQRQAEILTRRLARFEKERESLVPRNSRRAACTTAAPSTTFFSTSSSHHNYRHNPKQQQLPRQVALEIIDSIAITLNCTDIFELPKVARQLQRSLASVRALQQFVDNVCEAVFRQGNAFVPWSLRQEEPSDVPMILYKWIEMLEGAEEMRGRLKELQEQQEKSTRKVKQEQDNQDGSNQITTAGNIKQKQHQVITVSRIAAGKGFPEIEIFAPASRPRR